MYISAKEHARLRYRSRAIDRLVELAIAHTYNRERTYGGELNELDAEFSYDALRVLRPMITEREKRHTQKETPCPPKNT